MAPEEYRGRGVGRKLLVYVIEQARALDATLLTLATNSTSPTRSICMSRWAFSICRRSLPPMREQMCLWNSRWCKA